MKCSVYIATSVDGFIAKKDGSVDWLHTAGKPDVEVDTGWDDYLASVDCLIMGRSTMEVISAMNLTAEQWPYGDIRIIVLSNTLKEAPDNMKGRVEMYSGDIDTLVTRLENEGHQHAYIDGGATIQTFLNLELINEMIITRAPVLLGEGIPLFGKTSKEIRLEQAKATAFANDFVQVTYMVNYQ
ncbi:dihydrofolate reductase family protein [Photobacterium sp. OFAV2-7]|uniref:dihydrofolate reductase family protein n=1 Tax=Photobacterium sp. OFAV2-7 TaxID=2917748 RepID=UPI001EF6684F|nr:dihydrofolate reductase family protein [Photobacterium sp. OFAV2-7]MCG7587597.1 dihydrofolate reductase family protein [Photobacterium sp. OFAV2-7]